MCARVRHGRSGTEGARRFHRARTAVRRSTFRCQGSASGADSICGGRGQRGVMRNVKEKVEEILDSDGALTTSSNAIEGERTLTPQAKSTQSKSAEETGSRAKVCEVKRRRILTSLTCVRDAHATSPWKRRGVEKEPHPALPWTKRGIGGRLIRGPLPGPGRMGERVHTRLSRGQGEVWEGAALALAIA
jgi:hypothetical protein